LKNWIDTFLSIKTVSFLKCAITYITQIRKQRINYSKKPMRNTFVKLRVLEENQLRLLLKSNVWPILCYWNSSTLCKRLFCAPIRELFFTILDPFCIKICVNWLQICEIVKTMYCVGYKFSLCVIADLSGDYKE